MAKKAPKMVSVKTAAKPKAARTKKTDGKLSQLDAAVKVLTESREPMTTKAMIEEMAAKGYWSSPGGQTPSATLYAALIREIAKKGGEARFVKVEQGRFALNDGTTPVAANATKKTKNAKAEAKTADETTTN